VIIEEILAARVSMPMSKVKNRGFIRSHNDSGPKTE
jgi:hypothetical protein